MTHPAGDIEVYHSGRSFIDDTGFAVTSVPAGWSTDGHGSYTQSTPISVAQMQADLRAFVCQAVGAAAAYSLTAFVNDGTANSNTITCTATILNTAPVITLASSTASVTAGSTVSPATGVTVADDDDDDVTITAVISNTAKASWGSLPSGWTESPTGTITCSARTPAQAQTDLRALTVHGDAAGSTNITFVANDGTDDSETQTVALTVSASPLPMQAQLGLSKIIRKASVTGTYAALIGRRLIGSAQVSCPLSNAAVVYFKGDDGSDVPWQPGEWHEFHRCGSEFTSN